MRIRFKGYGFLLFLVPTLLLVIIRLVAGDLEDSHRALLTGVDLLLSGLILFLIATRLDRKVGIEVWSRTAWTTALFESQHVCWDIPLRLVGVVLFIAGAIFTLE
jgi:hypothetical protein